VFELLVILFFVLLTIMVVGHVLWLVAGWFFRLLLGTLPPPRDAVPCPFCERRTDSDRGRCQWCGQSLHSDLATELGDLLAFRRQLKRFEGEGTMTAAEADALRALAETHRKEIMGQPVWRLSPETALRTPPPEPVQQPPAPQPVEPSPIEPVIVEVVAEPEQSEQEPAGVGPVHELDTPDKVENLPAIEPPAIEPPAPPVPVPAWTPLPARPPRKSWLETLAGIMEEREIPWAEPIGLLVGGLLILGSSIALVISLWETLEQVPVFKFVLFMAAISAAFGMGLYIYHRWKLKSTGRFVLMLATLLVPLGYLGMASLSKEDWTPLILAAEVASLGISGWLVGLAARVVVPRWRWLQVVGVVGNSAAVLLIARLTGAGLQDLALTGVGLLPVALLATVVVGGLRRAFSHEAARDPETETSPRTVSRAVPLFILVGSAAFATAVSLGLLIAKGAQVHTLATALDYVAILLAMVALPVLACGLSVMRAAGEGSSAGMLRTIGTILAIIGVGVMLAALPLAWPQPAMLLAVGLFDAVALAWVALRQRLPIAHAGAAASATLVYLTGYHLLAGHLPLWTTTDLGPEMLRLLIAGEGGLALVGLAAVFGLVAELFSRWQRREHALPYAIACASVAMLSLMIVTGHALRNPTEAWSAAILYAGSGLGALGMNVRYRKPAVTYFGLGLLAAAIGWTLWWQAIPLGLTWASALLGLATMAVLASVLLETLVTKRPSPIAEEIRQAFVRPLDEGGLCASSLAALAMLHGPWPMLPLAGCTFWLGAVWLVTAWTRRSVGLMTASQMVLTLATVLATTAWLERFPWNTARPVDLMDPRCLQAYGIGLALLSLVWVAMRIATRASAVARHLFHSPSLNIDQMVAHLVVVGQLLLVIRHLWPALGQEIARLPAPTALLAMQQAAVGPAAWLLVGLLTLVMIVALWDRWEMGELVSSLLLAATVPWLIAGQFASQWATASALRWSLAVAFVLGVVVIWQRTRLYALARLLHAPVRNAKMAPLARWVVVATTALPVVGLTLAAACPQLAGTSPGGPVQASWFFQIAPNVSYLLPLVLVIAGLVGLALRETSAGYAFSAGLVVELGVTLGYLLALTTRGIAVDTAEVATALQVATIAAALWAIVWITARRWVNVWREGPVPGSAHVLMHAQIGLGALGNALLLAPALLAITFNKAGALVWEWPVAVGQAPGWLAMGLVVAAAVYRQLQAGKRLRPQLAGLAGMAILGLLACTITGMMSPDWGYRTLMLGWASYAVFVVLATWWVASVRTLPGAAGPPQALIRAAATWVITAGLLAVLLGLKLALLHRMPEDLLWAAAAIAVASLAGATMAVWRRHEGWAFAAAPGVNLAASLVVWYFRNDPFGDWWTLLLEANVIATAAVALVWLAARRRLYQLREMTVRTSPLLALQTTLGVTGCAAMLVPPVVHLLIHPSWLPTWAGELALAPGWVAVLLAAAAAAWYLRQVSPGDLTHVVGSLALALGVLTACLTATGFPNTWIESHVLATAWAAAGLLVLAIGYAGQNLRLAEQSALDHAHAKPACRIFPRGHVQFWVTVLGVLTVGLTLLHAVHHGPEPWWPIRAIAAVSLAFGLLAMWLRLPGYVWLSALLLNLAGTLIWHAYAPWSMLGLVETNALCLAIGAGLWSLVARLHRNGLPGSEVNSAVNSEAFPWPAFPPAALALGLTLAASVIAAFVFWDITGTAHPAIDRLGWTTLAVLAVASLILLWERTVRSPLANVYGVGLLGANMLAEAWADSPRMLGWLGAIDLAGFALLAALAGWLLPRGNRVWQTLRIPAAGRRSARDWFPQVQLFVAGVAAALSAWVALDPAFSTLPQFAVLRISGSLLGAVAALILIGTAIVMVAACVDRWRGVWQDVTIGLGLLLAANIGWALLNPEIPAPWLHRTVIALVAAVGMAVLAEPGLTWLLGVQSDWALRARRALPVLAGLVLGLLAVILVQEGFLRAESQNDVVALPAVVAVALALVSLSVTGIVFAVVPQWDPLHLTDRGRTAYVYAAEVLVGLVCLHLWLTKPHLFQLGILKHYWMLIVMGVAFGGALLSELFHRRGFPVLSEPLERTAAMLPLAPAIAFWLPIHPTTTALLAGNSPALWFFAGLFYGFLAVSRRSFGYSVLAAVATNLGLWILWDRLQWGFLEHPQLWLIPWGLTVLVAEYLNHRRLTSMQSASLRYLGLLMIYVPSSTEFLRAVGESLWLPLILISFSVLGVALGIALRIRSFLFLGLTFLSLVLTTMIWYASIRQQHMWVFWIFCIGLGLAVLAMVAFYEKRRNDVLAAVRQLKEWQR
jgi:hypothetical protein